MPILDVDGSYIKPPTIVKTILIEELDNVFTTQPIIPKIIAIEEQLKYPEEYILPEPIIETKLKYMSDFISINWNIYSPHVDYSDAPDILKKKQMLIVILQDIVPIYGFPSYRASSITLQKKILLQKGITVLDDSIFSYGYITKRQMFLHETEGLLGMPSLPEPVIRADPEASEFLTEMIEEPYKKLWLKIIIIIVIVLIVIVFGLVGFQYIKSYIGAKAVKRASK